MFASQVHGGLAPFGGDRLRFAKPPLAVVALVGAACLLAVVAFGVQGQRASEARPSVRDFIAPAEPTVSAPDLWLDAARTPRRFAMPGAAYGSLTDSRTRVQAEGRGRQDILTLGNTESATGLLHVAVTRPGAEGLPTSGFFVTMARAAAAEGLAVLHSDQPGAVATRYGTMEVAELTLARAGSPRGCLGYRLRTSAPDLQIAGLACEGSGQMPTREKLVCALETLTVLPGDADRELADFFTAAAFRHSPGCVRAVDVETPTATTKKAPGKPAKRAPGR